MSCTVEQFERIIPLLEMRRFLYCFLRDSFLQEPTRLFLQQVQREMKTDVFPWERENANIRAGIAVLREFMEQNNVKSEAVFDSVHWEYTRLFIGPERLPTPPWESAYCNESRLLFQIETLAVRKFYLKYGFISPVPGSEAEDHLGLELDFMAKLIDLALSEIDSQNRARVQTILSDQKVFLEEHLLKWVPALCQDIVQNADTGFYQGLAKVLEGVLILDLQGLNEMLQELS